MPVRIALLMGGDSSEREISKQSAQVVAHSLNRERYEPYVIEVNGAAWEYTNDGKTYSIDKNDFSLSLPEGTILFDAAFIAIHGTPGEDGKLQAYFDLIGIPYSTCGQLPAALTFSKAFTNAVLREQGIACGQARILQRGATYDTAELADNLGIPLFVKPSEAGSSFGISKVHEVNNLAAAIDKAFTESDTVVVEEFLDGTEVTCGIHNFRGELEALPLTEIVPKTDFFDYEAKYLGASDEITPARVDAATTQRVQELTKEVYQVLQLDSIARVDYILRAGVPYVIEVNTVPGLSEASLIPQQAKAAGYTLEEFFGMWVDHTLEKRHRKHS